MSRKRQPKAPVPPEAERPLARAERLRTEGDIEGAFAALGEAMREGVTPEASLLLADMLAAQGEIAAARMVVGEAGAGLALPKALAEALRSRAAPRRGIAAPVSRQAVAGDPAALVALGRALRQAGDETAAVAALRAALLAGPADAALDAVLGEGGGTKP